MATQFYEEQTPKDVKDLFKKYPVWFYTRTQIQCNGHGFNWEYITTTRPIICNGVSNATLTLTSKISDKLTSAKRKWEKAKDKYSKLKDEAKQALLTLKTFNNIRKELPEAAPMLPPPMSNALVVNFTSLKSRLNNQPDVKEKEVEIEDGDD